MNIWELMVKYGQEIGIVIAGLTTVILGWKKYLRPFKRRISSIWQVPGAIATLLTQHQEMLKILNGLKKEVEPNGGASLRDVVERTERKAALVTGLVRAHFDQETNARFEANPGGGCVWVNRTYLRWVGRSMDEILHNGWIVGIAPEDRDRVKQEWDECRKDMREFKLIYHMEHSDGSQFPVEAIAVSVRGWGHKVEGWMGTIRRYKRESKDGS